MNADQRARGRYLGGIVPFGYAVAAEMRLAGHPLSHEGVFWRA